MVIGSMIVAGALLVPGNQVSMVATGGQFATSVAAATPSAVTYDTAAVPVGSRVLVVERAETRDDGTEHTRVTLSVRGLAADRAFDAHVHTRPCGDRPQDAGPRYQHVKGAAKADPRNGVRLDLATDGSGDGEAVSEVGWRFRKREARSLVIHEPGRGGADRAAGSRLACLTVKFV